MNRLILAVPLALFAAQSYAAAPTPADDGFFFKPYVGADYQFSHYGNRDDAGISSDDLIQTDLSGGDVHVGARVHKNLGLEIGYFQTEHGDKSNILGSGLNSTVNIKGATFDALGYYPVAPKLELIGTAGVAYSKASLSIPTIGSGSSSEWLPRLGAGAQYWITDNLNARGIVRYQWANFDESVHNGVVATAGLNWQF